MSISRVFSNLTTFLIIAVASTCILSVMGSAQAGDQRGSQASYVDVQGTWSGTFFSKHSNVAPFSMTIVISKDDTGALVGDSSLSSDCLKDVKLKVTTSGSKIVLAGSNQQGDNITVRGMVDSTRTLLKATYILNGSASGRCETDDGSATLAKR